MKKYYMHQREIQQGSVRAETRETLLARIPWKILLLATIAVLGVMYLWLVNGAAAGGFEVSRLESKMTELDREYGRLDRSLSEATSLHRLQEASKEIGLREVGRVEYTADTSALVQR